jgi:hypothetical protein
VAFEKAHFILSKLLKRVFIASVLVKDEICQGVLGYANSLLTRWDSFEKSIVLKKIEFFNSIIKTKIAPIISDCTKSLSMHIDALTRKSREDRAFKYEVMQILFILRRGLLSVYSLVKDGVTQVTSSYKKSLLMHMYALTRRSGSGRTFKYKVSLALSIFRRKISSISRHVKDGVTNVISSYAKSLSMHLRALTRRSGSGRKFKHKVSVGLSIFQRKISSISSHVKGGVTHVISAYIKSLSMHLRALRKPIAIRHSLLLSLKKARLVGIRAKDKMRFIRKDKSK